MSKVLFTTRVGSVRQTLSRWMSRRQLAAFLRECRAENLCVRHRRGVYVVSARGDQ